MADEEFHEIQLTGKQLVFLFMATTVVSVVIFLCGVLVGRGVHGDRPAEGAGLAAAGAGADGTLQGMAPGEPPPDPPPPAADLGAELSYHERLDRDAPPAEQLKTDPPASRRPPPPPPAAAPPRAPADEGFAVQVTALRDRAAADTLAKNLLAKGYPAFVLPPAPGAPTIVYRVRVGPYGARREAEQIMRRLEREEQFKPIITR